ncbi:MAG: PD-(D/E)XK nuclease family transposase [Catalinimonas sp.]
MPNGCGRYARRCRNHSRCFLQRFEHRADHRTQPGRDQGLRPAHRPGPRGRRGRSFIVEMQLSAFPQFIQRAKFYAFHRFNALVQRGRYRFNDLTPIYVISLPAAPTYRGELYHQTVTLKKQRGELVDDQITHVIVELSKFNKTFSEKVTVE